MSWRYGTALIGISRSNANGVVFHILKARPWLRLASIFLLDTLLIRRLCRRLKPDLIHAWGSEKGAPMIAHRLGYPYLMTVQGLYAWYKEKISLPAYDVSSSGSNESVCRARPWSRPNPILPLIF